MPQHDLFLIFISRLNRLDVRYMVTGSVASIIYGEPRLTHDVDLVLSLHQADVNRLIKAFPLDEFYCPPAEVITIEVKRKHRGHFNLIHQATGFKADVYVAGQDNLHAWALGNRKKETVSGEEFWVAPVEYVIVRKLEYYREGGSEKHLRDIAGMVTLSSDMMDLKILKELIEDRELEKEWKTAEKLFHDNMT